MSEVSNRDRGPGLGLKQGFRTVTEDPEPNQCRLPGHHPSLDCAYCEENNLDLERKFTFLQYVGSRHPPPTPSRLVHLCPPLPPPTPSYRPPVTNPDRLWKTSFLSTDHRLRAYDPSPSEDSTSFRGLLLLVQSPLGSRPRRGNEVGSTTPPPPTPPTTHPGRVWGGGH